MAHRNILIVLETDPVTGVQHALSFARRMRVRVFILRIEQVDSDTDRTTWMDEILRDLLASAQQAGIDVSYHTSKGLALGELTTFVKKHAITLLIIGEEGWKLRGELERSIAEEPLLGCQLVEVRAKELTEKDP